MPPFKTYRVVIAEGGRWMIRGEDGQSVFGNLDFASPDLAAGALIASAREGGKEASLIRDEHGVATMVQVQDKPEPPPQSMGVLTLNLPNSAAHAFAYLIQETGETPGSLFGKAIGLYMLARNARKQGKVVGAADSPESLETEFTGF